MEFTAVLHIMCIVIRFRTLTHRPDVQRNPIFTCIMFFGFALRTVFLSFPFDSNESLHLRLTELSSPFIFLSIFTRFVCLTRNAFHCHIIWHMLTLCITDMICSIVLPLFVCTYTHTHMHTERQHCCHFSIIVFRYCILSIISLNLFLFALACSICTSLFGLIRYA